jgi:hypothetical protein
VPDQAEGMEQCPRLQLMRTWDRRFARFRRVGVRRAVRWRHKPLQHRKALAQRLAFEHWIARVPGGAQEPDGEAG